MTCAEYQHSVAAAAEPEPTQMEAMARHLEECAACRARLQADSVELVHALYQQARRLEQAEPLGGDAATISATNLEQLRSAARKAVEHLIEAVTSELALGLSPTFAALRAADSPFTAADEEQIAALLAARDYEAALDLLQHLEERVRSFSARTLSEVRQHEALCHAGQGDYLHARAYLAAAPAQPPLPGLWPDLLAALTQILVGDPHPARPLLEDAAQQWREIVEPLLRLYEERL
jgi:hypothetical protein